MALSNELKERSGGNCELCAINAATAVFTVSPKDDEDIANHVALCETCLNKIDKDNTPDYWRLLEGSIWNPEPAVQALSYRLLHQYKDQEWASGILHAVDIDEPVIQWALSAFEKADMHQDAFGNELHNGDTVVLTQALNVKGTNFSAAKGTVVKRIRLVPGNTGQIEGKINEQTIVILTKFVKRA